jgi:hypothetical protein
VQWGALSERTLLKKSFKDLTRANCGLLAFLWIQGMIMTPMKKTRFEQVPLEMIRKIIEENARRQKTNSSKPAKGIKKPDAKSDLVETTASNGLSERR